MTDEELDERSADFVRFCARFADIFGRKEPRAQAAKYLQGLMAAMCQAPVLGYGGQD